MLKYFRDRRKKLVAEGDLRLYLMYAIGEILLVMIGILLALQVNNWHEARKSRTEEILILNEIVENFNTGIRELERGFYYDSINFNAMRIIIKHMSKDLPYHDSLNQYFYNLHSFHLPEIPASGYETLKSKGLELLTNDQLRKKLINLFEQRLRYMRESIVYDGRMRHQEFHNSEYIAHFSIVSEDLGDVMPGNTVGNTLTQAKIIPLDYEALLADQRYENMLRSIYDNNKWLVSVKKRTLQMVQELQEEVILELERLK